MKALLVIDAQRGIINQGDFEKELSHIKMVIRDFEVANQPVIFIRHLDNQKESPLYRGADGSKLHDSIVSHAQTVIEKETPSAFF